MSLNNTSKFQFILTEIKNKILFLTLNRPEKRNAFSYELISELKVAIKSVENNPEVKIIVIKAAGDVFSAGADLESLQKLQHFTYEENLADSLHLKELFELIYLFPKIICAQIEGHAVAGGCGLATVCDFSFSTPNAKFGYTEVGIGFIPALVSFFLIRKIGEGKARELLLSGKLISAQEAKLMGLINEVVSTEDINKTVTEFAENIIKNVSSNSIQLTKKLINEIQNHSMQNALNMAAELNAQSRLSDDCKKGIQSFLDKKKIIW